jgi:hypothetical protein
VLDERRETDAFSSPRKQEDEPLSVEDANTLAGAR